MGAQPDDYGIKTYDFVLLFQLLRAPAKNEVCNNEGIEAPCRQGARWENALLYSTDEQRR